MSDRVSAGVVVTDVANGSPAARAGVRPGDVIIGVNRTAVKSPSDFTSAYDGAGNSVLLRIHRKGGSLFLVLKNNVGGHVVESNGQELNEEEEELEVSFPMQVTFEGLEPTDAIRERVDHQVDRLGRLGRSITHVRVSLSMPHKHR